MRQPDYQIVFKKLAEATAELGLGPNGEALNLTAEEAEQLEELRRLTLELEDPQLQFFTTT